MKNKNQHITVLLKEAVKTLQVKSDCWYIDATFGAGGHTGHILEQGGKVISFDFDQEAIEAGKQKFQSEIDQERLILVRENFAGLSTQVKELKANQKVDTICGALFDFGTSTDQLMSPERGFSFTGEGELDMRMDQRLGVKAKDLLALISEKQLSDLFFHEGGEKEARKIAKAIIRKRKQGEFITTNKELADLISQIKKGYSKTHPATKVFQALRIAVNSELDNIAQALPQALEIIEPGTRIVTISFHEGEDRIVKKTFKNWQNKNLGEAPGDQPFAPTEQELELNPRARSAKMRFFEKK